MAIDSKAFKIQLATGWLTGLLAPVIGYLIFISLYFKGVSFIDVFEIFRSRNVLPHVISLSVIINLVFFFTFIKMDKDYAARGVLGATFVYVFVVMYLKFF
jgi:hypothetical protein